MDYLILLALPNYKVQGKMYISVKWLDIIAEQIVKNTSYEY